MKDTFAAKNKKYELVRDRAVSLSDGHNVYRIRALRDIPEIGVSKGDLGGCVDNEDNLSHKGLCWVHDDACVFLKRKSLWERASARYCMGWG